MNFNDYQAAAVKTAIYPQDAAIMYPALGLTSEIGEVAEKVLGMECPVANRNALGMAAHGGNAAGQVKKIVRDDSSVLNPERRDAIAAEIGGVLWYAAALARDIGVDLDDIAVKNIEILASRKKRGVLKGDGDNR